MEIKVGDATYTAEFNGFTPIAYSRCFHVEKPNGTRRPKDITEAVGLIEPNFFPSPADGVDAAPAGKADPAATKQP